jgi:hypothetical protein
MHPLQGACAFDVWLPRAYQTVAGTIVVAPGMLAPSAVISQIHTFVDFCLRFPRPRLNPTLQTIQTIHQRATHNRDAYVVEIAGAAGGLPALETAITSRNDLNAFTHSAVEEGDDGYTPLHLACMGNKLDAVQRLLTFGGVKINQVRALLATSTTTVVDAAALMHC